MTTIWRNLTNHLMALMFICATGLAHADTIRQHDRLKELISALNPSAVLRFASPCFDCRVRDLTQELVLSVPATRKQLGNLESVALANLLRNDTTFMPAGLSKPCGPFVAEYAVMLGSKDRDPLLLISTSCQSLRVVGDEKIANYIFDFNPNVFSQVENLLNVH